MIKKILTITLFSLFVLTTNAQTSIGFAQTQLDMNQKGNDSYRKADKELNEIYKQILVEYKSDTLFINNLKASQRIWIKFRDAELIVKYPERDPGYYGSIHSVCVVNYLEKLTRERIKTLKVWIEGVDEGDACIGSIKTKE